MGGHDPEGFSAFLLAPTLEEYLATAASSSFLLVSGLVLAGLVAVWGLGGGWLPTPSYPPRLITLFALALQALAWPLVTPDFSLLGGFLLLSSASLLLKDAGSSPPLRYPPPGPCFLLSTLLVPRVRAWTRDVLVRQDRITSPAGTWLLYTHWLRSTPPASSWVPFVRAYLLSVSENLDLRFHPESTIHKGLELAAWCYFTSTTPRRLSDDTQAPVPERHRILQKLIADTPDVLRESSSVRDALSLTDVVNLLTRTSIKAEAEWGETLLGHLVEATDLPLAKNLLGDLLLWELYT